MHADGIYRSQVNITDAIINPQEFMSKVQDFVKSYGYRFDDTKYKYKEGKEEISFVMFRLECLREIDNYTQFEIIVEAQFEHARRVKKGLRTGGKIVVASKMNLDYDNKWERNPFLTLLQGIYERYIYYPTRKKLIGVIATEMEAVENKIKNYIRAHEARG